MREAELEVRAVHGALLVFDRALGRCLAGVGANFYRPWLFPLYSPRGRSVLREFPFDHPFHNGCFVAQHPVRAGGREVNFWAAPPPRGPADPLFVGVGRIEAEAPSVSGQGGPDVRIVLRCVWRDAAGAPVLEEEREHRLALAEGATLCEVASRLRAAYGEVELPQSKFGGIGVRLDPRLAPACGAEVIADDGRRGDAAVVHESASRFVAFEARCGARFGLCLIGRDAGQPWFVRDYGLALYNPALRRAIRLRAGESCENGLRLLAYDGKLDAMRLERWVGWRPALMPARSSE